MEMVDKIIKMVEKNMDKEKIIKQLEKLKGIK